jgi:hypothetical protein
MVCNLNCTIFTGLHARLVIMNIIDNKHFLTILFHLILIAAEFRTLRSAYFALHSIGFSGTFATTQSRSFSFFTFDKSVLGLKKLPLERYRATFSQNGPSLQS